MSAKKQGEASTPKVTEAKEKNEKMKHIDGFIRNVRLLSLDMTKRFPKDAMVDRIGKRIALGTSTDPLFVMKTVGEYLLKFSKQITDRDEKFFVERSYKEEIEEGEKQDKVDMVNYLMPKIKEKFKALSATDKESYFDTISEMLETYVAFQLLSE